jgi:hypothetical protein
MPLPFGLSAFDPFCEALVAFVATRSFPLPLHEAIHIVAATVRIITEARQLLWIAVASEHAHPSRHIRSSHAGRVETCSHATDAVAQ